MRKIVVTLIAACAVVLGLAVTSSTAFADDDSGRSVSIGGVTVDVCAQTSLQGIVDQVNRRNGSTLDISLADVTSVLGTDNLSDYRLSHCVHDRGGRPTHPGGVLCPGGAHDNFGRCLPLPGTTTYNSCLDYSRHGVFNIRRGDPRYRTQFDRFGDGIACESNPSVTVVDGDCNTVTTQEGVLVNNWKTYQNRYNTYLRDEYLAHRDTAHLTQLNTLYRSWMTARDRYNAQHRNLTVVCHNNAPTINYTIDQTPAQACGCNTSTPTTTVEAPAPTTVTETAPAPAPQIVTVPKTSSGVDTGDGSFPLEQG